MLSDIKEVQKAGARGVLVGVLTNDNEIDVSAMKNIVAVAKRVNLSVTFHRAIDFTKSPVESVDKCLEVGVDRIFSLGSRTNEVNVNMIQQMMRRLINKRDAIGAWRKTADKVALVAGWQLGDSKSPTNSSLGSHTRSSSGASVASVGGHSRTASGSSSSATDATFRAQKGMPLGDFVNETKVHEICLFGSSLFLDKNKSDGKRGVSAAVTSAKGGRKTQSIFSRAKAR
jgi:hypothetical protein